MKLFEAVGPALGKFPDRGGIMGGYFWLTDAQLGGAVLSESPK